jgi:hypothetical protein
VEYPQIDDIFSGILELMTVGNTSTRSLSRQTLFHILQGCPTIDVASIRKATHGNYAYSSLAGYAAIARVASKAIAGFIARIPEEPRRLTIRQERELIDAPYADELAIAVAASKPWQYPAGLHSEEGSHPPQGLQALRRFAMERLLEPA